MEIEESDIKEDASINEEEIEGIIMEIKAQCAVRRKLQARKYKFIQRPRIYSKVQPKKKLNPKEMEQNNTSPNIVEEQTDTNQGQNNL